MANIKNRLTKLEQKHRADEELVVATGLDFFYGDISATRAMTSREFKERAARGLAGFYEDITKQEAEKNQPANAD